jgi:hypothetical protein
MNPYDIPDRPIPSWVDNYDDKPHICPECGCEINETSSNVHGVLQIILSLICWRLIPVRFPRLVWSWPSSSISARSLR